MNIKKFDLFPSDFFHSFSLRVMRFFTKENMPLIKVSCWKYICHNFQSDLDDQSREEGKGEGRNCLGDKTFDFLFFVKNIEGVEF